MADEDSARPAADPTGPLHLQRYLTTCADPLADIIRSCAAHPINDVRSLHCQCRNTQIIQKRPAEPLFGSGGGGTQDSVRERTTIIRRQNIESSRKSIPAYRRPGDEQPADPPEAQPDRRVVCRFFSMYTNDEDGIVHSHCRRCERVIILYDRALYWGIKRTNPTPQTYPHVCSCGGHTFEVALGFSYPDERLDENDLDTITIAVRCANCNEVAIVFDDEAT